MIVENCPFQRDPRLRREATTLQSAGYQVSVVCPALRPGQPLREYIQGIAVYRYRPLAVGRTSLGHFLEYAYATLAIAVLSLVVMVREGFDVIHVANPPDTLVLTVAPYKILGKRIIYDQHDLCPELFEAKFPQLRWLFPMVVWSEYWSYRLADHVIVTNESYRDNALARGNLPTSKVTIVRNGPDLGSICSASVDRELRDKSKNLFAYAGTIGSQDDLDCMCRILYRLRYDLGREDFCCVVMGDGDALPEVRNLVRELHLEDNFWFTGWVDDPDTFLCYLTTADICVSPESSTPYNNRSTFVKIMDYMAAGKPIVAFDLCETRISAADSALYADAGDERQFALRLAELMDQPVLRSELGGRGQKRIRDGLAWQYSTPKLLWAYNACLANGNQTCRTYHAKISEATTSDKQEEDDLSGIAKTSTDS